MTYLHRVVVFSLLRYLCTAALFALLLPFSADAQSGPDTNGDATTPPQQQVEIAPVAPDVAIARRIESILNATDWYQNIEVNAEEGVVFLDGVAESDANRTWARELAAKTAGVVAVVNRITLDEGRLWSLAPALSELENLAQDAITVLPLVLLATLILPLAWYGARLVSHLIRWLLQGRTSSPFLRAVISRAIALPVFLLGLYIVLQVAGLTQLALSLVGGAGVLGIVLGFAFRDIAENFLSSLILSVRRPFQRGDFITVAGLTGTVTSMSTRSTLLTSAEGNQIHIPNSTIFKNVIENFTSSPDRRGDFVVGIGYDASTSDAQQIILDCLIAHNAVLVKPEPMVLVDELGTSTVNIKSYYWFDGHTISLIKLKSALLRAVKSQLTNNGISMPDEAREVIFPEGVKVFGDTDTAPDLAPQRPAITQGPPELGSNPAEGDLLAENPPPNDEPGQPPERDLLGTA